MKIAEFKTKETQQILRKEARRFYKYCRTDCKYTIEEAKSDSIENLYMMERCTWLQAEKVVAELRLEEV